MIFPTESKKKHLANRRNEKMIFPTESKDKHLARKKKLNSI